MSVSIFSGDENLNIHLSFHNREFDGYEKHFSKKAFERFFL